MLTGLLASTMMEVTSAAPPMIRAHRPLDQAFQTDPQGQKKKVHAAEGNKAAWDTLWLCPVSSKQREGPSQNLYLRYIFRTAE